MNPDKNSNSPEWANGIKVATIKKWVFGGCDDTARTDLECIKEFVPPVVKSIPSREIVSTGTVTSEKVTVEVTLSKAQIEGR